MENQEMIIELKGISKVFGDGFKAVDNFNLEVKRGEFVTLLGPSGCGKTTTLRMIAGFDVPTAGDILLNEAHHVAINISKGEKADKGGADRVGLCTIELGTFLKGACDPQVVTIQRLLNCLGYTDQSGNVLAVDGELGEKTSYAITQFQKDKGMTGINFGTVGGGTWRLLLG